MTSSPVDEPSAPPVSTDPEDDGVVWAAVVNDLGQYSVWPVDRAVPAGWSMVGEPGTRQQCLNLVGRLWIDIVPRRS